MLEKINSLKNSHVKKLVDTRIEEFKQNGGKASREIFRELCFCILTANFNAERSIEIQRKIGDGFLTLPIPQ
ncbi:MAG: N-glycosylase, partial [Nitrososphaerales archaeon]